MALKIAKARDPKSGKLLIEKAADLVGKGDPDQVLPLLDQAIALASDDSDILEQAGALYLQAGDPERASNALIDALKRSHNPEALNTLGVSLFQAGNKPQALLCLEKAVELGATTAQANLTLAKRSIPKVSGNANPEIENLLKQYSARVTACMIVKNEERFLRDCLESLAGVVDEIIVVDTGSTDQTVSIAQEMGASVHTFPWTGDFSAARNESLRHATGDWILVIDADERLDPESKEALRRAIANPFANSYFIQLINHLGKHSNGAMLPRLFRKHQNAFYTGRIHEQITPQLEKAGFKHLHNSAIRILHEGYRPDIVEERGKRARNKELLIEQLRESPGDLYTQFQLGKEYLFEGVDLDRAIELLSSVCDGLEAMTPPHPTGAEAFFALAMAYRQANRDDKAMEICRRGLTSYPEYPDTRYCLAQLLMNRNQFEQAALQFRQCRLSADRIFNCTSDPAYSSWRSLWGEGICQIKLGQIAAGAELLEQAVVSAPTPPKELLTDSAEAHMLQGNFPLALGQYYGVSSQQLEAADWLRIAEAHFHLGEHRTALETLGNIEDESLLGRTHWLKGECLLWLRDLPGAQAAFEAALAQDEADSLATTGLAVCQLIGGNVADVRSAKAVPSELLSLADLIEGETVPHDLSPQETSAWALVFRHAIGSGSMAVPEAVIGFALEKASAVPELCRQLAGVLLKFDAAGLALDLLQAALPASEEHPEHLCLLGEALETLGERDLARDAYQACLAIQPETSFASARLALLKKGI